MNPSPPGAGSHRATVLIRGAHVHPEGTSSPRCRAVALRGDRVLRLGAGPHDLDDLTEPGTVCVDLPDLCIVPGFVDAHVHQIEATQDLDTVDICPAGSVADVVALLRDAVAAAPSGGWIVSRRGWHESNVAERRLPTTTELDGVSTSAPIMVRRGSQLAVLNSAGIERAAAMALADGEVRCAGTVRGRDAIGRLLGFDGARSVDERATGLARVCSLHASRGIVGARDAGVDAEELATYERLAARDGLAVRTDLLVAIPRTLDAGAKLAFLDELGPPPGRRGPCLSITGIKLFADGHIADAAIRPGSASNQHSPGELLMTAGEIAEIASRAVQLRWRVGCHVVGDRALDETLDAFDAVLRGNAAVATGQLVVEHALIADEAQRRRAAALGVGVTVQHPLVDLYGAQMVAEWGPTLADRASPVRGWLDSGALVAAGSDGHVVPFDPLRSIAGLASRRTMAAGVLGRDEGVGLEAAVRLHTVHSRWLMSFADAPAGLVAGGLADLVALDGCVFERAAEELVDGCTPVLTVCGGRSTFDPGSLWPGQSLADAH